MMELMQGRAHILAQACLVKSRQSSLAALHFRDFSAATFGYPNP